MYRFAAVTDRTAPPGPGVRTLTTAGLVGVVGAIVLGILGMHGLSQHGAMPSHADRQLVTVAPGTSAHTEHVAMNHSGHAAVAGGQTGATAVAAGDEGGSVVHMAMLCAAMVLAAAAGVLLVLRLWRLAHATVLGLKARVQAVRTFASDRLATGPPAVWEFSVVRC